jgi:hypothetical protein
MGGPDVNRHLFAAFAGIILFAAPAAAQRIESPYRFVDTRQFLGVHASHVRTSEGVLEAGPQDGVAFGAGWAIRVTGPFMFGAEMSYLPTTRTVRDTAFVAADSLFAALGEADMHILMGMATLRLNITGPRTWNALQPFALMGAGVAIDLAPTGAVEREIPATRRFDFGTTFAGQVGGGVEWFPSPRLSTRLDARHMSWRLRVPEGFAQTPIGARLSRADWEGNTVLTAGVSIHF